MNTKASRYIKKWTLYLREAIKPIQMSHNQYAQASGTELCHFLRDAVAAVRRPLGQVSLVCGWRSAYETLGYVSQSVPKVTRTIANDLLSLC